MKESLESARNIHQILLVILSVVGIFAVSIIFETNPFDAGLKMINDGERDVNNAIYKDRLRIKYDSNAVKIYKQAEIDTSNKASKNRDTTKAANLKSKIKEQELEHQRNSKKYTRFISQLKNDIDTAEANLDFKQFKSSNELLTEVLINKALVEVNYENVLHSNMMMLKWDTAYSEILPKSDLYIDSLISLSRLNELLYSGDSPKLFTDVNGQNNGNLDYFYSINKDKSIRECKELLKKESANFKNNPHNDVDLSGIRVASKHMYLVAPFVTLCLMIYLLSLVTHLNATVKLLRDAETAQEFPWLALFPSGFNRFLLFISIVLYPAVITWSTALSSELPASEKTNWTTGYFFFFLIFGFILFGKTLELSVRIHKRPFI